MRIVWSFSMEGDNIFPYRNMDIKLGDREMAIIPKAVLKQIRVEDISDNFQISTWYIVQKFVPMI